MGLGTRNVVNDDAIGKVVFGGIGHKAKCNGGFILIIQDHVVFRRQCLGGLVCMCGLIAKVPYDAAHKDDLLSKPIGLFDGASHCIKGTAAGECDLEEIVLEVVLETTQALFMVDLGEDTEACTMLGANGLA